MNCVICFCRFLHQKRPLILLIVGHKIYVKSRIQHELAFSNMKFIYCLPNGTLNGSMSELMII